MGKIIDLTSKRFGRVMSIAPATPLTPITSNGRYIGFLFHRGQQGVEAFTRETRSLGRFISEEEAIVALLNSKGAQS